MRQVSLLAAILLIAVTAGSHSGGITGSESAHLLPFESDSFAILDADDAFANLQEATLDHEMKMDGAFQGGKFGRHPGHPHGQGSHLAPVLFQLGLDQDQRVQIFGFVRAQHESMRGVLEGLRTVNADLIATANEERRSIMDAVHNGEMTREEAREQLHAISERTHDAIRDNPDNEPYLQQICDSRQTLIDQIRSILDDGQAATWDEWVSGLDGGCFGG